MQACASRDIVFAKKSRKGPLKTKQKGACDDGIGYKYRYDYWHRDE